MESVSIKPMSFSDYLGVKFTEKDVEKLMNIKIIKNNPILINKYAQYIVDSLGITPENICTFIRDELITHGLPKDCLKKLDNKYKNQKQRKNRLGLLILRNDLDSRKSVDNAMSTLWD